MASLKRKAEPLGSSPTDQKKQKQGSLTAFFGAPKPAATDNKPNAAASSATPAPTAKFDKEKWISSLTSRQKTLLKLEIDTLDPSWLAQLKDDITSPWFCELKTFLQNEIDTGKKIFPPLDEVYSW